MMRVYQTAIVCIVFSVNTFAQKYSAKCDLEITINGKEIHPTDSSTYPRFSMDQNLPVYEIDSGSVKDTLYVKVDPVNPCADCKTLLRGVECYFEGAGDVYLTGFTDSTIYAFPLAGVLFDDSYGGPCEILFYISVSWGGYPDSDLRSQFILRLK